MRIKNRLEAWATRDFIQPPLPCLGQIMNERGGGLLGVCLCLSAMFPG